MQLEDILGLLIPLSWVLMLIAERFFSGRTFPKVQGWWWLGGIFFLLTMILNIALPMALPTGWAAQHSLVNATGLPVVLQIAAGFLMATLVDFLFHRAEHRFPFMWRWFHQVHHSPQRVDVLGAFYTSPLEILSAVLYSWASTTVLVGVTPLASATVGFLFAFGSIFQHWNIRTPHWVGYVLQRPESHCLHHEYDVHARNYAVFPVWDMLAGSFANPQAFAGRVGFEASHARKVGAMLMGRDQSV
jgi:sterol desaturase/sphingolipid hydroxylase (fatty acid hydroxylase superfamily)